VTAEELEAEFDKIAKAYQIEIENVKSAISEKRSKRMSRSEKRRYRKKFRRDRRSQSSRKEARQKSGCES
jgi:hypothetical protein